MTLRVILFDMSELRRLPKPLHMPVQVLDIAVQIRIVVPDRAHVQLEMLHVHSVEPDQCWIGEDVDFRQITPQEKCLALRFEQLLESVERAEDAATCALVALLVGCEAGAVDAAVQLWHQPRSHIVDLASADLRIQIQLPLRTVLRQEMVEGRVEHAQNLVRLVIDDLAGFLVPEHGHGEFARVFVIEGRRAEVDLVQECRVVEMVDRAAGVFGVRGGEAPAAVVFWVGAHDAEGDEAL